MTKSITSECIAQMVQNAIANDKEGSLPRETLKRAEVWHTRAKDLKAQGLLPKDIHTETLAEFLCSYDHRAWVFDFWPGDIVQSSADGIGIVKQISINREVSVLLASGEEKTLGYHDVYHSVLPKEFLTIAKAQLQDKVHEKVDEAFKGNNQ